MNRSLTKNYYSAHIVLAANCLRAALRSLGANSTFFLIMKHGLKGDMIFGAASGGEMILGKHRVLPRQWSQSCLLYPMQSIIIAANLQIWNGFLEQLKTISLAVRMRETSLFNQVLRKNRQQSLMCFLRSIYIYLKTWYCLAMVKKQTNNLHTLNACGRND